MVAAATAAVVLLPVAALAAGVVLRRDRVTARATAVSVAAAAAVLLLCTVPGAVAASSAATGQEVVTVDVGWAPSSNVPWNDLTQIDLFNLATTAGPALDTSNISNVDVPAWVARAHSHGVKAKIQIGGEGNNNWGTACNDTNRAQFVQNLITFATSNGFDAVDLDIEDGPWSAIGPPNPAMTTCIQAISTAAHAKGLFLSEDVITNWQGPWLAPSKDYVDQYQLMTFGDTLAQAQADVQATINQGLPANKFILGVDVADYPPPSGGCGQFATYAAQAGLKGTFVWTTRADSDRGNACADGLAGISSPTPTPGASLSSATLSFGSQTVGSTSAAQSATLTNSGNAPLTISSIAVAGTNAADFTRTTTCPTSPSTLAAGASCSISVTFTPSASGTRTASLTITDNAATSPQTISLSGSGAASATPAPQVSLSPTSLGFGAITVGSSAPAKTTTLTNSGTAALTISSIALSGANAADYSRTTTCPLSPSTLAAGASCAISVVFSPSAAGTRTASVTVTDNAAGSPHTIALTGSGTTSSGAAASPALVTGEGSGGAPQVRTFDPSNGNNTSSFLAFGAAFGGGVHVAVGDVTGDGKADVVAGAGPGGAPYVNVFDGATGAKVSSFLAFGAAFAGGVYVATGDLNGDGKAEVIAGAGAGGGPYINVFDGTTGNRSNSFLAFGATFTGGVRVAAGDVTGDGKAEILAGAGPGGGPYVNVFDGTSGLRLNSFLAFGAGFAGGVFVAAGDVTGDGRADIVAGAGAGGGPYVNVFDGVTGAKISSFLAFGAGFGGGVRVAAADVNGDSRADLVAGAGAGGGPYVNVFDAVTGAKTSSFMAYGATFTGGVFVAAGNVAPITSQADMTAPSTPTGLSTSAATQTSLTLSWTAATDDVGVTGYGRYRNGTLVSSGTGTTYQFTGLTCGTTYTLGVDAYDAAGNRSGRATVNGTTSACSTPASGGLHVSGNRLLDANNNPVQLHGVNYSGAEFACIQGWGIFDGPSDAASITAIKSWNSNIVHLGLNEDCILGINGVASAYAGSNYMNAIVAYVNALHAQGLYAEVSLMWAAPGTQQALDHPAILDQDHSPAALQAIANAFKNDTKTIIGLQSEPHAITWACWKNGGSSCSVGYTALGMQGALDAVRSTGATNVVTASGIDYANNLSQWLTYKPTDSLNQLMAEAHVYGGNSCSSTSCFDANYAPVANSVPVVFGETGETYDASSCGSTNVSTFMNWADAHNVGYEAWVWNTWGNCSSLISDFNGTPANAYATWVKNHYAARP